ncbi:YihY family inner membrane protein [Sinorhizobium medicae]|uniref:YihY family inner membrane protein n=1 Tax=Sinorhizobium medicae TaxID=110321 RepID=A0A6G1WMR9_9HYPH|nr:YihY/virulence factor BrkB family protein [Sinorhizobium medicae]MDX0407476.1 YihY family inner membrane protein [Sinorhizobium medicae]MDX0413240.1 YihY family inner membrane protein [Sinorhizobium medicae]MDX0419406.1 YihY family inner membrane protein [Sinorhizobium medicae]MDX0429758.1 YihY family inner membrane protein [Sinorhizobium medicae]MDX0449868.1 YihY family inner membrane protein [Sinorhizobium medicae]
MSSGETSGSGDQARNETNRGRAADSPGEIPARGLRDVFWRVVAQVSEDRISLVAAGVTFYVLLSVFPALASLVSIYGLVSDPGTIAEQASYLAAILPAQSLQLMTDQLKALASQNTSSLSLGFIGGLLFALWSARNGVSALFEAMNIAYDETEKRGFIRLALLSIGFTLAGLILTAVLIGAIAVLPAMLSFLDLKLQGIISFARWPVMLLLIAAVITLIYRYGPSREPAKLRWLTWGAALSTVCWLVASLAFSYYIDNFANYNATYGALGALIGFMLWIWISTMIVIVGAELNAELEHQTARDSTTGPPKAVGKRNAYVADTVGDTKD